MTLRIYQAVCEHLTSSAVSSDLYLLPSLIIYLSILCLISVSFSPGGPVGFVSVDARAAGVRGDAAENRSDRSSDLKVTRAA